MVQSVPGDGARQYSYAALCVDGEPAGRDGRRTRAVPCRLRSRQQLRRDDARPEIVRPSERLPASRVHRADGSNTTDPGTTASLLDMNPRVWGWHTLRTSGVDFPPPVAPRPRRPVTEDSPERRRVMASPSTDTPTVVREMPAAGSPPRVPRTLRGPRESAIFARRSASGSSSSCSGTCSPVASRAVRS